jgi:aarF domain-containing kinase
MQTLVDNDAQPHATTTAAPVDERTRAQRREIARIGFDAYLRMVLIHNFVHADMHPGNILVRIDESTNDVRLVFLDCGLVSELSDTDNENFQDLFITIVVEGDAEKCD